MLTTNANSLICFSSSSKSVSDNTPAVSMTSLYACGWNFAENSARSSWIANLRACRRLFSSSCVGRRPLHAFYLRDKSINETFSLWWFDLQSGLSARERRRLKQRQKGDKNAVPTPPSVAVLPSPSEVIAAKVKRSQESYQGGTPFVISLRELTCSLLISFLLS